MRKKRLLETISFLMKLSEIGDTVFVLANGKLPLVYFGAIVISGSSEKFAIDTARPSSATQRQLTGENTAREMR